MIPIFIYQELIGPYGAEALRKFGETEKYYQIYEHGADFEVDNSGDYTPAVLPSKQIKKNIRREAQFMFGKPPEIRVICPEEPKSENGKPNEAAMQAYLNAVLKDNRWPDKLIKGARDCLIGARVSLKVNIAEDKLRIVFVPADGFVYETALDDIDTIERVAFFYTLQDDEDRDRQRIWVQKYWMEQGCCKVSERITDGYGETISGYDAKVNTDTCLDRIPAYVIVNDGLSGDTDGISEIEDLKKDDSWYGRLKSGNIDTLRGGMNQITWMSGVKPECSKSFARKPGAVWDIQADPAQAPGDSNAPTVQVETLSNDFAYSEAFHNTLANLKRDMHDLTGVPDLDLDSTKSIITSGKGLKALYWPLICRCEEKMNAWRPALEWLAETILYAAEVYPSLRKVYGDFTPAPHDITIDNQYPLPEDEDAERELDLSEVGNKARSIKSYLIKWGGPDRKGMSPEEADAEIDQMARERQILEDTFAGGLTGGA
ncbi:MAG: phage portal protein [Clostridiales bacterium]|nr:phage portal protein [Clostridiales bacterium]